jgi:hypothetical protein
MSKFYCGGLTTSGRRGIRVYTRRLWPLICFLLSASPVGQAVTEQKGTFHPACSSYVNTNKDTLGGIIIMQKKIPIKVIKREERNRQQQQSAAEVETERPTAKEAAREMVATVSQWVNEFQQKRRSETAQAIKTLFTDPTPQTSKA